MSEGDIGIVEAPEMSSARLLSATLIHQKMSDRQLLHEWDIYTRLQLFRPLIFQTDFAVPHSRHETFAPDWRGLHHNKDPKKIRIKMKRTAVPFPALL